ncbi:MAG: hypothetical protein AAF098_03545 [Pseudomonadota bacterium]
MHGLARIAMNGRFRALLLAVACFGTMLFAWIGAAIVALVTLRKGVQEGVWLLLWTGLPVLLLAKVSGDGSVLALLLGTSFLAIVLRSTVNLAYAGLASIAVAIVTGLGLLWFGQNLLAELAQMFEQFFASLEQQTSTSGAQAVRLQPPTQLQLAGMMGTANGAMSFLCLALARYWQASLYNPGGFGSEFRALRFPTAIVFTLLLVGLAGASFGISYRSWAAAALLPLTIAGFSLLHAGARLRGRGSFGLSLIYVTWIVFDAVKLLLVGFAVADTLLDFRGRWSAGSGGNAGGSSSTPAGESAVEGQRESESDRFSDGGDDGREQPTDLGDLPSKDRNVRLQDGQGSKAANDSDDDSQTS